MSTLEPFQEASEISFEQPSSVKERARSYDARIMVLVGKAIEDVSRVKKRPGHVIPWERLIEPIKYPLSTTLPRGARKKHDRLARLTVNLSAEKAKGEKGKIKKFKTKLGEFWVVRDMLLYIHGKKISAKKMAIFQEDAIKNPSIPEKLRKKLLKKKLFPVSAKDMEFADKTSDQLSKQILAAIHEADKEIEKLNEQKEEEGLSVAPKELSERIASQQTPNVNMIAIQLLAKNVLRAWSKSEEIIEKKAQQKRDIYKKELVEEEKIKENKVRMILKHALREYLVQLARLTRSVEEEENVKESGYITSGG